MSIVKISRKIALYLRLLLFWLLHPAGSLAGRRACVRIRDKTAVFFKFSYFFHILMIQYDIIAVKQLLYRDYGQDDTQAKPAPVPMADYIKSLRDYDIITTGCADKSAIEKHWFGGALLRPVSIISCIGL